jgi:diguanylate cyclase (GGDEF)-like protein
MKRTPVDAAFLTMAGLADYESVVDVERVRSIEGRLARRILLVTLCFGASISAIKAATLLARDGDPVVTASFGLSSLVFSALVLLLWRGARRRLVASFGLATFGIAMVAGSLQAIETGDVSHHFWSFTFAPTALAVSGRKRGLMWCALAGVVCVPILFIHARLSTDPSIAPLFREGAFAMAVIVAVVYVYATLRDRYERMADQLNARLEALATTDQLTGAFNRRMMERLLERARDRLRAPEDRSAVLILDVDHFKRVNDEHGHEAGDRVLEQLVGVARAVLRDDDEIGRWGGEEFLVLSHADSTEAVEHVGERVREAIAAHDFGIGAPVTVSVGGALRRADEEHDSLLRRADAALYRAKDGGRDRVVLAD